MSDFDLMSGFDKDSGAPGDTAPLTTSTTTQPPSEGSNRDSLNLDDFEKVEADQLLGGPNATLSSSGLGNVPESTQAAAVGLVDDIMAQVKNTEQDLFSNFTPTGITTASETKSDDKSPSDAFKIDADFDKDLKVSPSDAFKIDTDFDRDLKMSPSDAFKIDTDFDKDLKVSSSFEPSSNMFTTGGISPVDDKSSGGFDLGFGITSSTGGGVPETDSFTSDLLATAPPPPSSSLLGDLSPKHDAKPLDTASFDDFMSKPVDDFMSKPADDFMSKAKPVDDFMSKPADDFMSKAADDKGMFQDFSIPDIKESVKDVAQPLFDSAFSSGAAAEASPTLQREPSPDLRNPTPPRTPTAPVQDLTSAKQPTPPRTPTPPPREPTPPRTPTPPPREPTPPPKVIIPPPREPTPPPREPTPPPREPTPPPREPTPPPKVPTPVPREPTPPPREPTPPPKEPTPPPRKAPAPPPRTPTPPPVLVETVPSVPLQEATASSSTKKKYTVSSSTRNAFNVFKPMVDLIYWRDVKKTGVVFGSLMVILLSLAYLSLISVVAYTSLAVLTGTITFRVYKNIMQAVQKSQDGHPFKAILELDTDLPSDKVHEATDVIVSQLNSTVTELKRLFLVEDLVDSVKFGCLLWCLTYLGSWFNGLTLVILAVVALFSLPKVYEQNQAQIDQYVGLVRSQVNDVMSKVKAALPIGGNKEKAQ